MLTDELKLCKGLPYQGNKNAIALQILNKIKELKPNSCFFVDLFGGSFVMSAKALLLGYKVIYNELNSNVFNLVKFLINQTQNKSNQSKYGLLPEYFYEYADRNKFFDIKKQNNSSISLEQKAYNEFILLVYSYSNTKKNYLYGRDVEEYQQNVYNYLFFNDKTKKQQIKEYINNKELEDILFNITDTNIQNRFREYNKFLNKAENIGNCKKKYRKIDVYQRIQKTTNTFEIIAKNNLLKNLIILNKNYNEVNIEEEIYNHFNTKPNPNNTVIYCDHPYRNSYQDCYYSKKCKNVFDFQEFDNWFLNNKYQVFCSEYSQINGSSIALKMRKTNNMIKKTVTELLLSNKLCNCYLYDC